MKEKTRGRSPAAAPFIPGKTERKAYVLPKPAPAGNGKKTVQQKNYIMFE